jgi:hypothetical protein
MNKNIIKSSLNPNEFYIPLRVSNSSDGYQQLYTDNELKYYTDTNTLSTNSISGNFIGSSDSADNISKQGANNQLLFQTNNNTTSLIASTSINNQYLSHGTPPYWSSTPPFPEFRYFFTIFGNPIDGDAIINGGTMSSDMYYNNLTINGSLNTNGFKLFVNGRLNINSNISSDYFFNSNSSFEVITSSIKHSNNALSINNSVFRGGNGARITNSSLVDVSGGTASLIPNSTKINLCPNFINMRIDGKFITAGAAGGNGEKSTISNLAGGTGGKGGGILFICAREIIIKDSTIRLSALGGRGGNGAINPNNSNDYSSPGGGGGGGLIVIITTSIKFANGNDITNISSICNISGGSPGSNAQGKTYLSSATSGNQGLVRLIKVTST